MPLSATQRPFTINKTVIVVVGPMNDTFFAKLKQPAIWDVR